MPDPAPALPLPLPSEAYIDALESFIRQTYGSALTGPKVGALEAISIALELNQTLQIVHFARRMLKAAKGDSPDGMLSREPVGPEEAQRLLGLCAAVRAEDYADEAGAFHHGDAGDAWRERDHVHDCERLTVTLLDLYAERDKASGG